MQNPFRIALALVGLLSGAVSRGAPHPALTPPRIIEQPAWAFPLEVSQRMIFEGQATVLLSISDEGQLLDFIVLGFTHRAFAKEVVNAMPRLRFTPGMVRGEPATTRLPMTFHFEQQGNVVSTTAGDQVDRYMSRLRPQVTYQPTVCPGEKLDRPLQPSVVVSPEYPDELRGRAEEGEVTVDFYVDAQGRVRMPATAASAHPSFARTAIGAIEQWQFEPPTSNGEPVLVHVQQHFRFPAPPLARPQKSGGENHSAAPSPPTEGRATIASLPQL